MYFVNLTGMPLDLVHNGIKFHVHAWEHVDLPEELYDFIQSNIPKLEVDYPRYIAELEHDDPNIADQRLDAFIAAHLRESARVI